MNKIVVLGHKSRYVFCLKPKEMKNFFTLLTSLAVLLLFKPVKTQAQEFRCGTIASEKPLRATSSLPNENYVLNRTISVTAHIVHSKQGTPSTTKELIEADMNACNKYFEDMKLSFKLCSVNNIYNYNYSNLIYPGNDPDPTNELKTKYFEPKTLNIYYVSTIPNSKPICGFADMPSSENDIIAIAATNCMGSGKVLAHEVGHYFGLYHTFQPDFGQELPDGSNCSVAGDLLCDTPADIDGAFLVNADCEVTQSSAVNNVYYLPLTNNIMSYYSPTCKNKFTVGQYKRMAQFYYSHRSFLY